MFSLFPWREKWHESCMRSHNVSAIHYRLRKISSPRNKYLEVAMHDLDLKQVPSKPSLLTSKWNVHDLKTVVVYVQNEVTTHQGSVPFWTTE